MAARSPATMSIDTSAGLREEAELYAKSTESGNLLPRVHAAPSGQGFPADAEAGHDKLCQVRLGYRGL